jgi:hypothetical protein
MTAAAWRSPLLAESRHGPIMKGLSDVAGRLAWMDKQGIDRHVVGGWPDWFGYELPAAEGEAWCRLFNDAQVAAAGFPGAMISTLPRGNRQCARRRRPRSVLGGSG